MLSRSPTIVGSAGLICLAVYISKATWRVLQEIREKPQLGESHSSIEPLDEPMVIMKREESAPMLDEEARPPSKE